MAISVTEILGTDSVSGSRIVINENFAILKNEINLVEGFLNPSTGVLDLLTSIKTNILTVGDSSDKLYVSDGLFQILSDVNLTGNFNVTGHIINKLTNSATLNYDDDGSSVDIGSGVDVPSKSIYRIGNSASTTALVFTINLYSGVDGQEITFIYESGYEGDIEIIEAGTTPIIASPTENTINFSTAGDTVTLKCVNNSLGNLEWYIVSGHSYTTS